MHTNLLVLSCGVSIISAHVPHLNLTHQIPDLRCSSEIRNVKFQLAIVSLLKIWLYLKQMDKMKDKQVHLVYNKSV